MQTACFLIVKCLQNWIPAIGEWEKVIYFGFLFNNCYALTSLNVSKWDTSNANIFNAMFNECVNLTNIDVSNWKTSNVTQAVHTFLIVKADTSSRSKLRYVKCESVKWYVCILLWHYKLGYQQMERTETYRNQ